MTGPRPQPHPVDPRRPRPTRSRATLTIFATAVVVLTLVAIVPPAAAGLLAVEPGHRPAADRLSWASTAGLVGTTTALILSALVGLLQSAGGPGRRGGAA